MALITIISDWHNDDYYKGMITGLIKYNLPGADIIEITNKIENFNLGQAAFIALHTTKHFPEGSIHIIAVASEASNEHKHIVIKHNGSYFICTDNGIPGLMFKSHPELVVEIDSINEQNAFPEFNIFAKIAVFIAKGGNITELGQIKSHLFRQIEIMPGIGPDYISGVVIYNDSQGNAITNISKEMFDTYRKNRDFSIHFVSASYIIKKINKLYNETEKGEKLAIFNSIGLLEIAINEGSAKDLLGLEKSVSVKIRFK
jgi:S-adenosylmethionine hydrolase